MRTKLIDEILTICSVFKFLFIFLLKVKLVLSTNNQTIDNKTNILSCYTCIEPLVGYSKL